MDRTAGPPEEGHPGEPEPPGADEQDRYIRVKEVGLGDLSVLHAPCSAYIVLDMIDRGAGRCRQWGTGRGQPNFGLLLAIFVFIVLVRM